MIVSSKVEKEECNLIRSPHPTHLLTQQLSQHTVTILSDTIRQYQLYCALGHLVRIISNVH